LWWDLPEERTEDLRELPWYYILIAMSAIGIASEKREEVIVLKVGVWVWEAKHQ